MQSLCAKNKYTENRDYSLLIEEFTATVFLLTVPAISWCKVSTVADQ
jgi:hypothetical protein